MLGARTWPPRPELKESASWIQRIVSYLMLYNALQYEIGSDAFRFLSAERVGVPQSYRGGGWRAAIHLRGTKRTGPPAGERAAGFGSSAGRSRGGAGAQFGGHAGGALWGATGRRGVGDAEHAAAGGGTGVDPEPLRGARRDCRSAA